MASKKKPVRKTWWLNQFDDGSYCSQCGIRTRPFPVSHGTWVEVRITPITKKRKKS